MLNTSQYKNKGLLGLCRQAFHLRSLRNRLSFKQNRTSKQAPHSLGVRL